MDFSVYVIPIVVCIVFICGFIKKQDVFNSFIDGARENLYVTIDIMPTLIALMTAIGLMKASGLLDGITALAAPLAEFLGFPPECVSLALIRPISGSGATAVYENILGSNAPDSFAARTASVMMGSSETTFYTIAVYFGATKIKKTKHTLGCSLVGDITGFIFSSLLVRLFFMH
ncbi:MAG: spore maturation protein [Oscillospiraceae bacterium]